MSHTIAPQDRGVARLAAAVAPLTATQKSGPTQKDALGASGFVQPPLPAGWMGDQHRSQGAGVSVSALKDAIPRDPTAQDVEARTDGGQRSGGLQVAAQHLSGHVKGIGTSASANVVSGSEWVGSSDGGETVPRWDGAGKTVPRREGAGKTIKHEPDWEGGSPDQDSMADSPVCSNPRGGLRGDKREFIRGANTPVAVAKNEEPLGTPQPTRVTEEQQKQC